MYPLNDNDLDRLSRDAAEHYDVESSAAGWEALEKRLNRELPHKEEKDRKRFLFWLFFIAVMTGGTLVWMLNGNTPSNNLLGQNKDILKSANTNGDKATPVQQADAKQDNVKATSPDLAPGNNSSANPAAETVKNGSNVAAPISAKKNAARNPEPGIVKLDANNFTQSGNGPVKRNKLLISSNNDKSKKQAYGTAGKKSSSPVDDKDVVAADGNNNTPDNSGTDVKKDIAQPVNNSPVAEDKVADKADSKPKEEVKPATTEEAKKAITKKAGTVKSPLELGLVIGPDFSSVKFKYADETGFNVGLQIGYRLSNRWSLNTGVIYNKKNYKAAGSDFTPPKHDWTNYIKLDKLDGNCSMLDIPLNVRYDLSTGKKRFFVSTGLSTYLMSHQYYDYYYYNSMGVYSRKNWESDSSSHYIMSVVNLSVGFEKSIGKHFSIQAEPYLKIPVKGIGYGSMQMDSYGIYFSLKYRPQFRTKK